MPCWSRPCPSSAASRCSATASTWCRTTPHQKGRHQGPRQEGSGREVLQEGDWVVATPQRHALVDGNFSAEITQLIATQEDQTRPGGWCWRATTWPRLNRRTCREWKVIEEEELPAGI